MGGDQVQVNEPLLGRPLLHPLQRIDALFAGVSTRRDQLADHFMGDMTLRAIAIQPLLASRAEPALEAAG